MSTRALGQILRLSLATQALARQKPPGAGSILVITNLNEPDVDNAITDKVAGLWRAHGAADVQTFQFPVELGLGHDLTDLQQPDQNAPAVISAVVWGGKTSVALSCPFVSVVLARLDAGSTK